MDNKRRHHLVKEIGDIAALSSVGGLQIEESHTYSFRGMLNEFKQMVSWQKTYELLFPKQQKHIFLLAITVNLQLAETPYSLKSQEGILMYFHQLVAYIYLTRW